jgi:hypothetical protein
VKESAIKVRQKRKRKKNIVEAGSALFASSSLSLFLLTLLFQVLEIAARLIMGTCASLHATKIDAVVISSKTIPREKCTVATATTADQQQSITANDNNKAIADRKKRDRKGLSESAAWPGLYYYRTGKQPTTREPGVTKGESQCQEKHAGRRGAAEASDTMTVLDASCAANAEEHDGSAEDAHTLIYIFGA